MSRRMMGRTPARPTDGVTVEYVGDAIAAVLASIGETTPTTPSVPSTGVQGPAGPAGPQGPAGLPGLPGDDGESAYQIAVDNGFVGTQAAWLASLVGPAGPSGSGGGSAPSVGTPQSTSWFYGQGPPPTLVVGSKLGDFYLDTTTGTIYELS